MKAPANDRGRFVYLYFQCSEIDRVKWHICEEKFCRGFKLNRMQSGVVMKLTLTRSRLSRTYLKDSGSAGQVDPP